MNPERDTLYLDANATTPVLPTALAAMNEAAMGLYGNPSSTHATGLRARQLIDGVRERAARLLDSGAGQLVFVSGATEAIQTAVLSALCALRAQRDTGKPIAPLLLVGATEHKAVPQSLAHWNTLLGLNLQIQELPVDSQGRHDLAQLQALAPQTALLCTMAANNETGVISDLAGIEGVLTETASPALWLVDCVQALGKLPLRLAPSRIDYAAFSGHKLYAPKGIGLLYVRQGSPFTPLVMGGGQEGGLRSGTENMAGIAALGAVLQALEEGGTFHASAVLHGYRERLADALRQAFPGVVFNMPFEGSIPTTLNFSVPGLGSNALLDLLDAAGLRASGGSACSAAAAAPSFVLQAMGLPDWQTRSAVRMSFGPATPADVIDAACARLLHCGEAWRTAARSRPVDDAALGLGDATPAADRQLDKAGLRQLLQRHPETLLVDVREIYEHLAWQVLGNTSASVINIPLGDVPQQASAWLGNPARPLVFFCRSGRRSLRALQCLAARGHSHVWHLAGGLAMHPALGAAED
jgi:cysteine sulfinate desulfinase/cysteine desulfurase-like protein/rhodanese-related sulfurtransferase